MIKILIEEIWKDIEGYEGLYKISNLGRVWTIRNNRELIYKTNKSGYCLVNLSNNGVQKMYTIHRLVATTFIPNPSNLPEVNHINENKNNNCVDNLEWCTHKYNCNYGTRNERMVRKGIDSHNYGKRGILSHNYGRKASEETRLKMSKQRKGEGNGMYNKNHSDETKQKMIDNHVDCSGSNNPQAKKVYCDGRIFDYVGDFSDFYNINRGTATSWLNGRRKMPQKFKDLGLRYLIEEDLLN